MFWRPLFKITSYITCLICDKYFAESTLLAQFVYLLKHDIINVEDAISSSLLAENDNN